MHTYMPPEGEISPSKGGSRESKGATDVIRSLDSEGDTSGVFSFLVDGPIQNSLDTTTLLKSEKFNEDPTAEIIWMQYKYVHTPFNRLQAMATNGFLPKILSDCHFPV